LRLARANGAAEPAARIWSALLQARLAMDAGQAGRADQMLTSAESHTIHPVAVPAPSNRLR
jgi:hypothetical protein